MYKIKFRGGGEREAMDVIRTEHFYNFKVLLGLGSEKPKALF